MLGGGRDAARLQRRREGDRGRDAPRAAVAPKPRSVAAIVPPGRATSRTGARSTLTPRPGAGCAAVRRPCSRLKAAPRAPIFAAEAAGAPPTRFTSPPSWSTITSSGSRSPGGRRIACRSAISAGRRRGWGGCRRRGRRRRPGRRGSPPHRRRDLGAGEAGDDPLAGQLRSRSVWAADLGLGGTSRRARRRRRRRRRQDRQDGQGQPPPAPSLAPWADASGVRLSLARLAPKPHSPAVRAGS